MVGKIIDQLKIRVFSEIHHVQWQANGMVYGLVVFYINGSSQWVDYFTGDIVLQLASAILQVVERLHVYGRIVFTRCVLAM